MSGTSPTIRVQTYSLLTFLYKETNPARAREYQYCLEQNIKHKQIAQIHVFFDGEDGIEDHTLLDFVIKQGIPHSFLEGHSLCESAFDLVSAFFTNQRILLAHGDIYFDQTLSLLDTVDLTDTALALTSWRIDRAGEAKLDLGSQNYNTWIFESNDCIGTRISDYILKDASKTASLQLINPAKSIKTYHLHLEKPEEERKMSIFPQAHFHPTLSALVAPFPFFNLQRQNQQYKVLIEGAIQKVISHGQLIMGPELAALEMDLAHYVGVKECITVANGTDALLIALMALGVKAGDEVITVPLTWVSTAMVILRLGARPVFVDIDPTTYTMNPMALMKAISKKTKAIIPVSLYGQVADMDAILDIVGDIPVIEDGAQSFGAEYKGKKSLSLGTVGTTSFFPSKPFGCLGDGGAIFTDDSRLAADMRMVRTHGGNKGSFTFHRVGLNSRLDTIQAAVLLAKFPHFKEELQRRRLLASRYDSFFKKPNNEHHSYYAYTHRFQNRDAVKQLLQDNGIDTKIYYATCLHQLEVFAYLNHKIGDFPHAEKAVGEILSLPCDPFMSDKEHAHILKVLSWV